MRGWAAPGSLGTAALLGVSGTRNPLLTCTPSWGSRIGCAKAFCAQSPAMPPSQLGRSAPKSRRNGDPKRASGSCTLQRETLLQQQTTASPCLCAETQHKLFPPPALSYPSIGQSGAGLPLAPWALLLCWGSPEPETHFKRVLLRLEAGLGVRRPSSPKPQQCPPSQGGLYRTEVRLTNGTN